MKHKILVVVDVQNDFITGSLGSTIAQERVDNIVNKIKNFDGECIFVTRDTHDEDYLETKEGKALPVTHCIKGTDGWMIHPAVSKVLMDYDVQEKFQVFYINKPTFGSSALGQEIAAIRGDLEIEIVGFCTDICVVSNALIIKSCVYDRAEITVDSKCCAGTSAGAHDAALLVMKKCQINVV